MNCSFIFRTWHVKFEWVENSALTGGWLWLFQWLECPWFDPAAHMSKCPWTRYWTLNCSWCCVFRMWVVFSSGISPDVAPCIVVTATNLWMWMWVVTEMLILLKHFQHSGWNNSQFTWHRCHSIEANIHVWTNLYWYTSFDKEPSVADLWKHTSHRRQWT